MKECIYSIPITDALKKDCECPFCELETQFEYDLIYFYLGPSVMDDKNRSITDEHGFCSKHYSLLYEGQKRLPLALMLQTHLKAITNELEKNPEAYLKKQSSAGLLNKLFGSKAAGNTPDAESKSKLHKVNDSCIICHTLEEKTNLLYDNFFYLYKTEKEIEDLFNNSKGLCLPHFLKLQEKCSQHLPQDLCNKFMETSHSITLSNLKRVLSDLDWYIQKFDYRFNNDPWRNSKDAVPRTIHKLSGKLISLEEFKNNEKQY